MADREKVIKGLECCFNPHLEHSCLCRCADCPYNPPEEDDWYQQCQIELNRDALALLKEQEAVKPYIDIDEAKCPICKVKLTRQELLGDDVLFEDFFDYCPHCGKPVKW